MNKLKTISTNVCRPLLGVTFILSGRVKAIDPLGTQYKMEDYLEVLARQGMILNWMTLEASVVLSALESCLDVFILLAIRRRVVSEITLVFVVIMTVVTLWLTTANPIGGYGCFDDAIKLSNTETLLKDIVLLGCATVLAIWPARTWRFILRPSQRIVFNYAIFFIIVSGLYCLYKLPLFDFRPYHVRANIQQGMMISEGAEQPKFGTTFLLKKNGVTKEFTLDDYPDSTWTFVDNKTIQTAQGYVPPIRDFSIRAQQGDDLTQEVLNDMSHALLLISSHLEYADDSSLGDIDGIYEYVQTYNYPLYYLTSSTEPYIRRWQDLAGAEYPFYMTDETILKTIIRSNPGLLLLKKGTTIRKQSHNDLLKGAGMQRPLNEEVIGQMPVNNMSIRIIEIFLRFIPPLMLLTIVDRPQAWSQWLKFKKKEEKRYQRKEKDNKSAPKKEW